MSNAQSTTPLPAEDQAEKDFRHRQVEAMDAAAVQTIPADQRLTVAGLSSSCTDCGNLTRNNGPCPGGHYDQRPMCHSANDDYYAEVTVKGDLAEKYCRHCAKFGAEYRKSGACPDLLTQAGGLAVWDLERAILGCYVKRQARAAG